MNPLRLLPPETAHKIALWGLKHGLGPMAPADDPRLQFTLLGKTFSNPVGLAAGAEKKAEALVGWARMGFGLVEAGTVTLHPREGNPKPRVWRLGGGHLVNWLGLPGDGLAPFAASLEKFQKTPEREKLVLGVSLASPDGNLDEFRELAAACAPLADYLTLNASCPNVAHGAADAASAQVKAVVVEAGGKPVLLKLGPTRDGDSLKMMAEAALGAGAAGFVATNTAPFDRKDLLGSLPFAWPRHGGKPVGGYSGPLLLDTACWMIAELRALAPAVPLIGVGGIQSGADALRMLRAGANAVQVYTGLIYKGPKLLMDIKRAALREKA